MPFIKFKKIWQDDDTSINVEFGASNGALTTTQDIYVYPEELSGFGNKLGAYFPKLGKGEVVFEYGSEVENFYAYVLCKVTYRNLHQLNIEIRTNNNGDKKDQPLALSQFSIGIPVQSLNELGKKLAIWVEQMENEFVYEWNET